MSNQKSDKEKYVELHIGKHNIFFKKTYDIFYTINDVLIGVCFLIGSIFFYFEHLKNIGVTLFVLASILMLIRPTIRLVHHFHMKKVYGEQYEKTRGS
ncbi:YrhK family protein [Halobacillus sp. SY10]|uniref:YrhK family protein n=1 Tax=Halobacillus sp. SY10 TaxID=3381356 RepID=UPI00387A8373